MAMNGRQKAMTAALGSGSGMTMPVLPSDSIDMLRWIVEAAERGEIRLCDLRMETFQSPGYADFRTLNGRVEKMKLSNDQYAQINFEIRPTGVVRGASNPDDDSGDLYGDELASPSDTGDALARLTTAFNNGTLSVDKFRRAVVKLNQLGTMTADEARQAQAVLANLDDRLVPPLFDEPRKPVYKKPTTPPTPTGASAAREVIFDDDGSDPT